MLSNYGFFAVRGIRAATALLFSCALAFVSQPASADTIEVFLTGLNIELADGELTDADPVQGNSSDFLNSSLTLNGTPSGAPIDDVQFDLFVPSIPNIALTGGVGTVTAPAGGTLELTFPDEGDGPQFLDLSLDEVAVTVIDASTVQFAFGASIASGFNELTDQNLPFGLAFDDAEPITISFSTRVNPGSLAFDSGDIVGFSAAGSGEIRGEFDPDVNNQIAEPGTLGMVALAGLMGGAVAMRRRLG